MNDDIKEKKTKRIIEKIEGLATYVTIPRELAIYNVNIDSQEAKLLIDYITNLRQENERLIKELENISLDEASIRADVLLEQQDYKSRIEKAVEFINDDENLWVALGEDCGRPDDDLEELLNILNGRSDE